MPKRTTEASNQTAVLAQVLRSVDKCIADVKTLERDRDELRRLLHQQVKQVEAVSC